jgi:hypothetical protein
MIATSHTISTAENGAVIYANKKSTNACFETVLAFAGVDSQNVLFLAT